MRTASKQVYYQGWNRSPAQVGCMRQVLGAGALGRPRGIGWRGRWEGGSGWGIHVTPWIIHVNVWQKPLQYCKVISLQLIKINGKKKQSKTKQKKKKKTTQFKNWAKDLNGHFSRENIQMDNKKMLNIINLLGNENQNHGEIPLYNPQNAYNFFKKGKLQCYWGCGEVRTLITAEENVK